MKKIIVLLSILTLILITTLIKNSTKKIDEEIYSIRENLIFLNKRYENSKLENNFLSSSDKLSDYQKSYFDDFLEYKSLDKMKTISITNNDLIIGDLSILKND